MIVTRNRRLVLSALVVVTLILTVFAWAGGFSGGVGEVWGHAFVPQARGSRR